MTATLHGELAGFEEAAMSGRGEVYSFSTMYSVPVGYEEQKPYTVALVRLAEGPIVTAQLTDVDIEEVHIGMPVEMVTRRLREEGEEGQIIYGYKFRPPIERERTERESQQKSIAGSRE